MPFIRANYEELMLSMTKICRIRMKEGVELHLFAPRVENAVKRKVSGVEERGKISDYSPDGELFLFIEEVITHSIHTLFIELDKSMLHHGEKDEIWY